MPGRAGAYHCAFAQMVRAGGTGDRVWKRGALGGGGGGDWVEVPEGQVGDASSLSASISVLGGTWRLRFVETRAKVNDSPDAETAPSENAVQAEALLGVTAFSAGLVRRRQRVCELRLE